MINKMIKRKKAKCPHCEKLHEYTEVFFDVVNDNGFWEVICQQCDTVFGLIVTNPSESSMNPNFLVKGRHENKQPPQDLIFANDIIEYNFDLNKTSHFFDYGTAPVYKCEQTGTKLEIEAYKILRSSLQNIIDAYKNASTYYLANRCPDYEFVLIPLQVPCSCENTHIATFYCEFKKNGELQISENDYLLADISGTSIGSKLMGLFSKTDIMAFLEKLIIRWNLLSTKIIIASPFVGHQYLSKKAKLEIWNWLLSILDCNKTIFITRTRSLNKYKSLLEEVEGLDHTFLKKYDLENKIISSETKKNDFHAKVYAGLTTETAEVFSGSANLVKGSSIENICFIPMPRSDFDNKYWSRLNVSWPNSEISVRHWIVIKKEATGNWTANPEQGDNIQLPKI
mgnify:FL=1